MDLTPTALLGLLQVIYDNAFVRIVLALIGLNVVAGIAEACYRRTFALGALADWLLSRAFPYVLVAGALQVALAMLVGYEAVLGQYSDAFKALQVLVWGFVIASCVGHFLECLRGMGLPIPAALGSGGIHAEMIALEPHTGVVGEPLPPPAPPFMARRE